MKETNFLTSACRYCRSYKPEGRRGGSCQMLGVPVQSSWKACALASPAFETPLKKLEDIFQLKTPIELKSEEKVSAKLSKLDPDQSFQITSCHYSE